MLLGLSLALFSGICVGIFLAPMKTVEGLGWEWEHIWIVWSLVAMLLGPIALAALTIPHCIEVFETIGFPLLATTLVIGAVAGTSGFLYSRTIPVLGLGLATALNAGSGMATSLLPLVGVHRDTMLRPSGLLTIAGVAVTIAAICVCAKAGSLREQDAKAKDGAEISNPDKLTFLKAIVFCVVAGIIASGMNLGLAFPNRMFDIARRFGGSEFAANNTFLVPYLVGGFFSNFFYAAHRVRKNHTYSLFFTKGALRSTGWSIVMALLFVLGIGAYAGGVAVLGSFGAIIAWGIFTAATILTSSAWDMTQDEWSGRPVRVMAAGVGMLLGAILILGLAQYFHGFDSTREQATGNNSFPVTATIASQ